MGQTTIFDLAPGLRDKIYNYSTHARIFGRKTHCGVAVYSRYESEKYSRKWSTWAEIKDFIGDWRFLLNVKQCRLLQQVLPQAEIESLKADVLESTDMVYTKSFAIEEVVELMLGLELCSVIFDLSQHTVSADWSVWSFLEIVAKGARSRELIIDIAIVLLPAIAREDGYEKRAFKHEELPQISVPIR